MKDFDPIKLLYPEPRQATEYVLAKLNTCPASRETCLLANALGRLSGEMQFHGRTDEEILETYKKVFGDDS